MSELRDVLNDVITDRLPSTGDRITNLRTGKTFDAEVEQIQDIELNTELGRDAREAILVHVQSDSDAADQRINDQIQIIILGQITKWVIVRRSDNPADPQVEFGCRKWTTQDS